MRADTKVMVAAVRLSLFLATVCPQFLLDGVAGTPRGPSPTRPLDLIVAQPPSSPGGPQSSRARAERYVMPTARGSGDGTSWANAAAFESIDAMVAAVGAGGIVYVRADAGSYAFGAGPVTIAHGGSASDPVTLMGVAASLSPARAVIVGTRTAWTLPSNPEQVTNVSSWSVGPVIFRLAKGADHITFRLFDFQRAGAPFYLAGLTHTGITVEDCSAYNVRRFFEHAEGTSHIGTRIRRVTAVGFSKTGLRIRGDSHDVLLEDVVLNSGRLDRDNFATGVELNDTAHDVTRVRVSATNCHDTHWNEPDRFWNADGFASEVGNYNITRIDCISSGHTDAEFDDKGEKITHVNCTASGNKVNYKFWGCSHVNEDCKASAPHKRGGTTAQIQYWLAGTGDHLKRPGLAGDLVIRGGQIIDDDPCTIVFMTEGSNAQLRAVGVTIEKNAAAAQEVEIEGRGNIFLYGSPSDKTPPTITSAPALTALADVPQAHILRADEQATWSIVDGADEAAFSLVPNRKQATLKIRPFTAESKQVIVRARDASNNPADQTITVTIGANATTFMADNFDRPDQDLATHPDWTFIDGYGTPHDVRIRGRKLALFNTDFNGILYGSPDIGFPDHDVRVRIASVPSHGGGAICARVVDSWNLIAIKFSAAGIQLLARSRGDWHSLGATEKVPAIGDVLRLEVKGSSAVAKKNDVVILGPVATGGIGDGATRQGVLACDGAVDPWIDDYQVGTL